jgi:C-terminal processing protease CtpA/Prc
MSRRSLAALLLPVALLGCVSPPSAAQGDRASQNLHAFAKLYGYVRFFHPSDEASALAWDRFAVLGVGLVKDAPDAAALRARLEELFAPIAPTVRIYTEGPAAPTPWTPGDTAGLELVAWQHLGVNLGSTGSGAYSSLRLNRSIQVPAPGQGFGTVTQGMDATPLRGKRVRLTASARLAPEGREPEAHLWLRVDRPSGMGFFDNMDARPMRSTEWTRGEITGVVDSDAAQVVFGGFLRGVGTLWLDDFALAVEQPDGTWRPVPIENPGFEKGKDALRTRGSGGPPVRPGGNNWWWATSPGFSYDVTTDQHVGGTHALRIATTMIERKGPLFAAHPAPGETVDEALGGGLHALIPIALFSDSAGTLPHGDSAALARLDARLDGLAAVALDPTDERTRLGAVIIAWNVFQHFYPYFDLIQVDWNAELDSALAGARTAEDGEAFLHVLERLVARIQDGHGRVFSPKFSPNGAAPVLAQWIEGQAVVTASGVPSVRRGDAVLAVDGTPIADVVREREDRISGSPQWKRWRVMSELTAGRRDTPVRLTLDRAGTRVDVTLERGAPQRMREFDRPAITTVAPGVWYVDLDRATWPEIGAVLDSLAAARGVVFDLRGYPAGNHLILTHLLRDANTSQSWMRIPQIIHPDHERPAGYQMMGWQLGPQPPHIGGKVVFLTDGRAISYAESVMGFVEGYHLGEIVGQPTAGTNGNVNPFPVPGGYTITWTGMRVVKHDGSRHHLVGIRPTVPVERTRRAVTEGRDEFLEKALSLIGAR